MQREPGMGADVPAETPFPSLAAVVCELRAADDPGSLREQVGTILRERGGEIDPVEGNPDATAALFGPDAGDGAAAWSAVVAASEIRNAVAGAFGEAEVRIGVAASDVDRDPSSLGLWRTHVLDLATRMQLTAAPDEVIVNAGARQKVSGWVEVETADGTDPRSATFRLIGITADQAPSTETSPSPSPEHPQIPSFDLELGPSDADAAPADVDDPDVGWPELAIASLEDAGGFVDEADEGATQDADAGDASDQPDGGEAGEDPDGGDAQDDSDGGGDARDDDGGGDADGGSALEPAWGLVGRDAELEALRSAFAEVVAIARPAVVALHGPDGVGKTAIVATFAAELADAFVIPLECPPADLGGVTRPLVSLIETLAAVDRADDAVSIRDAIRPLLGDDADADADRLAALVIGDGVALASEVRPALAGLLRTSSRHAPIVIVADEVTELTRGGIRALTDLVRDADSAVLLVLVHAGSSAIRADRTIAVPPLGPDAIAEVADGVLGHGGLAPEARDGVLDAAAGNPLAAQQTVAMLLDDGFLRWEYGRWVPSVDLATLSLPIDVTALVDARIDRLETADRDLLALAAAFGETFPVAGIAENGDDAQARMRLDVLVERRFLAVVDDRDMAFAHPLIRRTAATTAPDVHQRAAAWLERTGRGRGPSGAEVVGARLAMAATGGDPELASRAAASLSLAAEGAAALGDDDAALELLRRATAALPHDDPRRTDLLLEAGLRIAQRGDSFAAERALAEASMAARAAGDARAEARANVLRASVRAVGGVSEEALETLREVADEAIALCEPANDDTGLAWAWSARAIVHRHRGHWAAVADAAERAAAHAAAAGRRADEIASLVQAARAVLDGPAPVAEARERSERLAERLRGSTPADHEADAISAVLLAREGRADEARARADAAIAALEGTAHRGTLARCLWLRAQIEIVTREGAAAEPFLRASIEASHDAQDAATRARAAATLANTLVDLGRNDGVESMIALARDGAARDDVFAQVAWRCARAKQRAAEGRGVEARAQVRTAVRMADQTDLVELRAATLLDHADVMRLLGRPNEAQPSARRALRSLERRGAASSAERARAMIDLLKHRRPEPDDDASGDRLAGDAVAEDAGPFADLAAPAAAPPAPVEPAAAPVEDAFTPPPGTRHATVPATADGGDPPAEPERRERRWFW